MPAGELPVRKTYTCQPSENQTENDRSFLYFVEQEVAGAPSADRLADKAAASFLSLGALDRAPGIDADARNLRSWLALMIAKGTTRSTATRYLAKLHALYRRVMGDGAESLFASLRQDLERPELWHPAPNPGALECILKIPYKVQSLTAEEKETARILFYLLSLGGLDFTTAIEAAFDTPRPALEQVDTIVELQKSSGRRKYLFSLSQGKTTPRRITAALSQRLGRLLASFGAPVSDGISSATIAGWWVEAALRAGIAPDVIAAVAGTVPSACKWLGIVRPATLTATQHEETLRRVADWLNPVTPRWYALHLRGNVSPGDIMERLRDINPGLAASAHFFYPTRTRLRIAGKKKVKVEEPLIRHIAFVKIAPDRVRALMGAAGEMAWCYKDTNAPGAPYSVIPGESMKAFQRFIGIFDEESRLELVRDINFFQGQKVRITGGIYAGLEGEVLKEASSDNDDTLQTFILKLSHSQYLKWEVHIAAHHLETIHHS